MKPKIGRPKRSLCDCGRPVGRHSEAGVTICDRCYYLDGQWRKIGNIRTTKNPTG